MLKEFKEFIREKVLLKPDDKILLAVSGGIDSMVMTNLFSRLKNEFGIAHCNFSLRGKESDKDEDFVRQYSFDHSIPFYSVKFDTIRYAKQYGLSIQMAARELRYNWFEQVRIDNHFDLIAIAHNMNDSTETFLINLNRGTGIAGLAGIKPAQGKIIRPLLFATRQKIIDYTKEHGVHFREDVSNSETKYTRNKIRHLIIPLFKEINPSFETKIIETSERLSEVNEIVYRYVENIRSIISKKNGDDSLVDVNLLLAYQSNKTILYELFKIYGISGLLIKDLYNVIAGKTGGKIITPTHRIIKNRNYLIISPHTKAEKQSYEINSISELINLPVIRSAQYINISPGYPIPSDPSIAYLDAEKIIFPLTIRNYKQGDYFFPLGMKKKKKLSDYFIDKKYSLIDKEKALVITTAGEIVWIIGERIDERFKITAKTKKAFIIET